MHLGRFLRGLLQKSVDEFRVAVVVTKAMDVKFNLSSLPILISVRVHSMAQFRITQECSAFKSGLIFFKFAS
jgi:hypothetical protein